MSLPHVRRLVAHGGCLPPAAGLPPSVFHSFFRLAHCGGISSTSADWSLMGAVCPLPLGFPRVFFIVFLGWRIAEELAPRQQIHRSWGLSAPCRWASPEFRGLAPTTLHIGYKKRAAVRLLLTFCMGGSVILQGFVYRSTLVRLVLKPFKVF